MSKRNRQKRNIPRQKRPGTFGLAQGAKYQFLQQAGPLAEDDKPAINALFQFIHEHEREFAQAYAVGKPFENVLQELGFPLGMDKWKQLSQNRLDE
jgi:hypothetical protein